MQAAVVGGALVTAGHPQALVVPWDMGFSGKSRTGMWTWDSLGNIVLGCFHAWFAMTVTCIAGDNFFFPLASD